ncbi:hypothetical protein TUM12370_18180 [Salmonella enterica subsp. enterica serovar Choleraesuis]|nr:hypothetical protein TUM12370_18180 [Salmonella enterica subsp. enterica serovar Choleraesuis]
MLWALATESDLARHFSYCSIWQRPWIATGHTVTILAKTRPVELTIWQVVLPDRIQLFAARQTSPTHWYFALQR